MRRRRYYSRLVHVSPYRIDSHTHNRLVFWALVFTQMCTCPPFSLSSFVMVTCESSTAKIVPGEQAAMSRDEFVKFLDIRCLVVKAFQRRLA